MGAAVHSFTALKTIMIENEFKIMLTEEQYKKVLGLYDFETVVQTNHYFDTDDLQMSARHITVRVRELDGKFFLQVKLPTSVNFSRVELSAELDGLPDSISAEDFETLFSKSADAPDGERFPEVKRLGELTTTRSIYKFDGGEIDLDRSEYFGKTDYEAEIEFTNEIAARAVLAELSGKIGVSPGTEVCTGKVRRFLEEYKNSCQFDSC